MELSLWPFIAVALPLVLVPGASTAVVLRNSIGGGVRAGLLTALGCNAASVCYGLLTAFGFAAVLQEWPSVWLVLRIAGVAFLGWLGLTSLWRAARPASTGAIAGGGPARNGRGAAVSGFFTNFLNPSLTAFYLVILPQFIPRGAPFARGAMTLTAVHVSMAFAWHSTWAVGGAALARTLSSGWPRRTLDLIAGIALLALAASLLDP